MVGILGLYGDAIDSTSNGRLVPTDPLIDGLSLLSLAEEDKMNDYLVNNEYLSIKMVESVRRAELIAEKMQKSLLVISAYPGLYCDRGRIVAKKPCPCGRFGRGDIGNEPCVCSVEQIAKWYRNLRKCYMDCLWVEDIFTWRRIVIKNVNEAVEMLLKHAVSEFGCIDQLSKFMATAKAIMVLDKQKIIQPEHIAEALSYRCRY